MSAICKWLGKAPTSEFSQLIWGSCWAHLSWMPKEPRQTAPGQVMIFYLTASFLQLHHFKLQTWQTPNTVHLWQTNINVRLPDVSQYLNATISQFTHTRTHMYLCTGDKQINIYLYKYLKQQYLCIDLWCKLTHRLHYITLCYIISITLYSCYIDTVVFVALRQLPCVLLPVSCVTYAWNDITCTSTRTHVIYIYKPMNKHIQTYIYT